MSKLKTNFIYDAIYQILILIIPFITTPYIARTIGAEGVGVYSYTYSIVYYFMMFALLGMNNYGNREVAKVKDNKEKLNYTFSSIYFLQLATTILVSIIYILYVTLFDNQYLKIEIIQIIYLISVAFDINWLFCGLQKFKVTITRSAIIKICTLVLIFAFVRNENDLVKYILILALMTLANQLVLWPFLKNEVKFVKTRLKDILKHMKPTLILFVPVLAMSIYRVMDKIMVGKISSVIEVGYYENAEKMLNIILSVVSALGTVTLPQMTYLYTNNKMDEYYKILKKSITLILFMVFPVIFGFLATADDLVLLYLGENFIQSATLLKILSFSLLFSPIASIIRMQLLIPRSKDKEYIISVIVGAIANLVINFVLINKMGAVGASISTIIAECLVAILQCYFVKEEFKLKDYVYSMINFAIKSLIMFMIVSFIGRNINQKILKLAIQIIVGITIYGILNFRYITSQIDIKKILKLKNNRVNGNDK